MIDEVHGFRSFDERDLLGFVDGTENPEGASAAAAALIGEEDPGFAGGSYVVVQKYLHDLEAWGALPIAEQERAIGRQKLSDVEIPDEEKAANAHVALNTITDADGEELQIVRLNMPFGKVGDGEFGKRTRKPSRLGMVMDAGSAARSGASRCGPHALGARWRKAGAQGAATGDTP